MHRQTDRQDDRPIAYGKSFYKRSPKNATFSADTERVKLEKPEPATWRKSSTGMETVNK